VVVYARAKRLRANASLGARIEGDLRGAQERSR